MARIMGLLAGCTAQGGIQASGRLAWQAILNAQGALGTPALFCYGDRGPNEPSRVREVFHTDSRRGAILAALSGRHRADLVLVWHVQLLRLLPLFRLPGAARIVLFLHGIEAWRRQRFPERLLLRRVDLFLSNSDFTWRRFLEYHPECAATQHQTVPLGIGAPSESSTPPPRTPPTALMLSRLDRAEDYKGHREMLAAWPLVRQRVPDAELWIAGDGDLRPELEQTAAGAGVGPSVRFLGRVSEPQKECLIAQSRCMALPSRGEGFGLVYAEAMRLGRPCLVSTLDAGREVVDPPRYGLAVDPDDSAGLSEAIARLLIDGPEWRRWSGLARERYETFYTAGHFQQRLRTALASPRQTLAGAR